MIDDLLRPAFAPEKKLQPPARWRNWWRARLDHRIYCSECGAHAVVRAAQIIEPPCPHFNTYPSKEVAEIAASKALGTPWAEVAEHACATKVGERP